MKLNIVSFYLPTEFPKGYDQIEISFNDSGNEIHTLESFLKTDQRELIESGPTIRTIDGKYEWNMEIGKWEKQ